MRVDPDGVIPAQHAHEVVGDAVGQHDGHAGADAHNLDVWHGVQARQDRFEAVVGQHQRITAREQDIAHDGRLFDVGKPALDFVLVRNAFHVADLALARAVPAVHGADIADVEQDAVGVAVRDAGSRAVAVFRERVAHLLGLHDQFRAVRECLLEDRVVAQVLRIDQRQVVRRDRQRELFQRAADGRFLVLREPDGEEFLKRLDRAHGVPDLPAPVVPVVVGMCAQAFSDFLLFTVGGTDDAIPPSCGVARRGADRSCGPR